MENKCIHWSCMSLELMLQSYQFFEPGLDTIKRLVELQLWMKITLTDSSYNSQPYKPDLIRFYGWRAISYIYIMTSYVF